MYTVFVDGRRWDAYKTLREAKRIRKSLKENSLFRKAAIKIFGPKGGEY